jgi:CRP-like cAMP-binding protein
MSLLKTTDVYHRLNLIFQAFEISIPEEELIKLINIMSIKELKKGEFFSRAGEESYSFAFISKGIVRFYYDAVEGKEFNQSFHRENDFIMSYMSIMSKKPSSFNVQALEPTTLYQGDYRVFSEFYKQHPVWNELSRKLHEYNFIVKTEREADLLTKDALGRYHAFCERYPDLLERISQHHIALYLGINPVSLARLLSKVK